MGMGFVQVDEEPPEEDDDEIRHGKSIVPPPTDQLYTADQVFALIDAAVLATMKKYH